MSGPLIANQTPVAGALGGGVCRLVSSDGCEGSLFTNRLMGKVAQTTGLEVSAEKGSGLRGDFNRPAAGVELPRPSVSAPQPDMTPDLVAQNTMSLSNG